MVNNVAVVGHSHPGVADAAARQMRLLNTNSRFLFDSMGRFAERLVALVPSPLDTVFLVNSGSEANELALRLARTATGRRDVVAVQGAYHGWTGAIHGLNTSPFYPEALRNPEPWLRVVAAPNPYRGAFGADVPDAGARYADHVKAACDAAAESGPGVAAFLSEPQLGNAGGVLTPQGYLETAYRHVRDAGGLCVADEVQVGYARLGRWFWAFEEQGVVPDIVTIAKPAGNGHPIGAVITTREISERFRRQATLFSSAGGGPVSCEIGIAVLDAIRDEGLQANARLVGDVLRCGLNQLADRHELIGAIHGTGLHLGVELVRDRATKTPATAEASWICERMLELGVIVRPTGDFSNVIKVKPPLCVDEAATELFLSAFDRTLAEGPPRSAEETPR